MLSTTIEPEADVILPTGNEWVDTLKEWKGYETDAEVAAFLDCSFQNVSSWRTGRTKLGTLEAVKIGLALGVNPLFVIASTEYHAAKTPAKQRFWRASASPIEPKEPNPKKKRSA